MVRVSCNSFVIILLAQLFALAQRSPEGKLTCAEIGSVRHIPFHSDEGVADAAYNRLRKKSWAVVPCLINQMTNATLTPDPRSAPVYPKVRVGDVAFWVILDITAIPYDSMFPEEVRVRFKDTGVYAYFDWVNRRGHRKILQRNVANWYEFHKPPAAAKPAGEADSKRGIPPTAATHQRKHPVNNGKVTQYAHDVPIG